MKLTTCSAILLIGALASTAAAQDETRYIGERMFTRDGAYWVQHDPDGNQYDVQPDVITVKFRDELTLVAQSVLHDRLDAEVLRSAVTGFIDVRIDSNKDVFEAIDEYMASGLIEIAEPNTFGRYLAIPDDPSYGSQWQWPIVDAEEAWDLNTGDPSIIVAVLDSGTEFSHEDLGMGADAYQNVWLNAGEDAWSSPNDPTTGNGVDDDLNGYVDDWKGYDFSSGNNDSEGSYFHGTAVAGMIAAKSNNGVGIASVAGGWNNAGVSIMIAGVGDTAPDGSVIDDATLYAIDKGAHIVQLSLTVGQSSAIDAAFDLAYNTENMTIICASGNDGTDSVGYPSSNVNVIAVGSTTSSDLRSSFSNHGPDVEVSAPGSSIYTLDLNDGYGSTSGTSFAAPLTSGVAALMLSTNPDLTNVQIRQLLKDTADKVGGYDYNWDPAMPGHSYELGYGRVNADQAIQAAASYGFIFEDGFESGDVSSWSSYKPLP
ncbi:MAG: S8 family serine peptidase [bacterium]|nr:S8 family serine peptidase [bacterium]